MAFCWVVDGWDVRGWVKEEDRSSTSINIREFPHFIFWCSIWLSIFGTPRSLSTTRNQPRCPCGVFSDFLSKVSFTSLTLYFFLRSPVSSVQTFQGWKKVGRRPDSPGDSHYTLSGEPLASKDSDVSSMIAEWHQSLPLFFFVGEPSGLLDIRSDRSIAPPSAISKSFPLLTECCCENEKHAISIGYLHLYPAFLMVTCDVLYNRLVSKLIVHGFQIPLYIV